MFWTHTTDCRKKFKLNPALHFCFREILLHTCHRYQLAVPLYCIMPDHIHLLSIGLQESSDQLKATSFLRKYFGKHIDPILWQQQGHDHVVREDERQSGIYADTIEYILANPVRAGLVQKWQDYTYLGALLPGYPDLDRRDANFNDRFWKLLDKEPSQ